MSEHVEVPKQSTTEKEFHFDVPTALFVGRIFGIVLLVVSLVLWVGWYTKRQEQIRSELIPYKAATEMVPIKKEDIQENSWSLVQFESSDNKIHMTANEDYQLFTAKIMTIRANPDDPNMVDFVRRTIFLGEVKSTEEVLDTQTRTSPEYKAAESVWVEAQIKGTE